MWDFINYNYENFVITAGILVASILLLNLIHFLVFFAKWFTKIIKRTILKKNSNPFLNPQKSKLKIFKFLKCPVKLSKCKIKPILFALNIILQIRNFILNVFKFLFKWHFYYLNIILNIALIIVVFLILMPAPKVIDSNPKAGERWLDPESFIEIEFNRPVNIDDITVNMAPEIKGRWEPVKLFGRFNLVTKMRFYPEETVMPDEDMLLYIVGYDPDKIGEDMIEFKSSYVPTVVSSNISNQEINISVDSVLLFNLDHQNSSAVEWSIVSNPAFEYELRTTSSKIEIIPKTRLELNTDYEIKIYRQKISYNIQTGEVVKRSEKEEVYSLMFKTDSVALIGSIEPSGTGVKPDQIVKIVFNKKIDQKQIEDLFEIDPKVNGSFSWDETGQILEFKPDSPFEKETKYRILLKNGINYDGVATLKDYIFDFETLGKVRVLSFSPTNGAINIYPTTSVKVTFDQEVDHSSAEQHFSIYPNMSGSFKWDGNTMIFTPSSSFSYETNYTVTVTKGVKSIYGIDSQEDFKTTFKTRAETFSLNVPYYRQVRRFECELLATRMVLAYRGVYMGTDQIMYEIGIDPTPYDAVNNIWGDPDRYYVGDVNGNPKGYGVNLGPLARVARNHGRTAKVVSGWNASQVAYEVQNGNPVIILAQNNYSAPTDISWHTPTGKYVHAINGTHAYVVVGFKGSPDNPTAMLLQDPWYRGGSRRWHSMSLFYRLWGYHGNSALIIY